ncbi:hypothetical protein [Oligella sp. MSHR50489EDL]|uniref:hypothetical protein n=1 Tax=Oligella sp. MSHR50489EDL TaxID=3139409 RepID=UPI003D8143D7
MSINGVDRLYRRRGVRTVSWLYKYADGRTETLITAPIDDKTAIYEAEITAKRKALDIQAGQVVAGTVAELIERFLAEIAPTRYADQSKNGIYSRRLVANKLIEVFGQMSPASLKTLHGYQYLDARAKSGAPQAANKELSFLRVVCTQAVRWGLIESNPFLNMESNVSDKTVRDITRSQVVRFYLWAVKQDGQTKVLGCAALFAFLTGFRATEVRNYEKSGITADGVMVLNAKRKLGERQLYKLRHWSLKLRCVVARALEVDKPSLYLFPPHRGNKPYTRSGWGSVWRKSWSDYLGIAESDLVNHPEYFSLQDIRPASITEKLEYRDDDAYDFAAHSNPSTTRKHYDRRKINRANALK